MNSTYTILPFRKFHDAKTSFKTIAKEPVLIIIKNNDNKKIYNKQIDVITMLYDKYMKAIDNLEKILFSHSTTTMITAKKKEYNTAKKDFQKFLKDKEVNYMNQFDYDKVYKDNTARKLMNEKTAFKFFPYITLDNSEMNIIQSCLAK